MATKQTALRKRQQIASASKTMFLWVAGASVVVGISTVVGISLWQKISFNQRVINQRLSTAGILEENVSVADELKKNILVRASEDETLENLRADEGDQRLQVILDALPATKNPVALGASLEQKLLPSPDGSLSIDELSVDTAFDSAGESTGTDDTSKDDKGAQTIPFSFTVVSKSKADTAVKQFRALLLRLERSIRAINVVSAEVTFDVSGAKMIVNAEAYYAPAITAAPKTETFTPEGIKQ